MVKPNKNKNCKQKNGDTADDNFPSDENQNMTSNRRSINQENTSSHRQYNRQRTQTTRNKNVKASDSLAQDQLKQGTKEFQTIGKVLESLGFCFKEPSSVSLSKQKETHNEKKARLPDQVEPEVQGSSKQHGPDGDKSASWKNNLFMGQDLGFSGFFVLITLVQVVSVMVVMVRYTRTFQSFLINKLMEDIINLRNNLRDKKLLIEQLQKESQGQNERLLDLKKHHQRLHEEQLQRTEELNEILSQRMERQSQEILKQLSKKQLGASEVKGGDQTRNSLFDLSANKEDDMCKCPCHLHENGNNDPENTDPKKSFFDRRPLRKKENEKSSHNRQAAEQHENISHMIQTNNASDPDVQKGEGNRKSKQYIPEANFHQKEQTSPAVDFGPKDFYDGSGNADDVKMNHSKDVRTNSRRNEIEDEITSRNHSYIIDTQEWQRCIDSKDIQEADRLVNERILPDQDLLNRATDVFGMSSVTVQKICDSICCFMKEKVKKVVSVYPAIDCRLTSTRKQITFVILTAQPSVVDINEYRCYFKSLHETSSTLTDENIAIKELENDCQKNLSEAEKIRKILNKRSKSLMKNHTNISRISISWIKSKGHGTNTHSKEQKTCIAVNVRVKGFVPINEKDLPKTIDGIDVDVREGVVLSYGGGPNDHHECLRMGCAVHCNLTNEHGNILGGTLGGFVEIDNVLHCISCAHIFFTAHDMAKLEKYRNGLCYLGSELGKFQACQPVFPGSQVFGEGIRAVYKEGGDGETGVDAVLIKMEKRLPVDGEFPDCPYKRNLGIENPRYTSGKMYDRDEVDRLIRSKTHTVVKFGCISGWTRGCFRFDGGSVRLCSIAAPYNNFEVVLHNQIEIENIGDSRFAENGDSGALVFTDEDNKLSAIGIVEGGMSDSIYVYITPIRDVFVALDLPNVHNMKTFRPIQNQNSPFQSMDQELSYDLPSRSNSALSITSESSLHNLTENVESLQQEIPQEIAKHSTEVKDCVKEELSPIRSELGTLRSDVSDMKEATAETAECLKREMKNELHKSHSELQRSMAKMQKQMQNNIKEEIKEQIKEQTKEQTNLLMKVSEMLNTILSQNTNRSQSSAQNQVQNPNHGHNFANTHSSFCPESSTMLPDMTSNPVADTENAFASQSAMPTTSRNSESNTFDHSGK